MDTIATTVAVSNHSLTDLALQVATKYPVFPCRVDKRPATKHGFKDASRDPATVRAMFADPAAALIGVPTGDVTDLCVFDIDPDGMSWLEANRALFPTTRTHHTRRDGRHILLHMPDWDVRSSAGKIAPGVDVRANGGFIVWWPAHGGAIEHAGVIAEVPVS